MDHSGMPGGAMAEAACAACRVVDSRVVFEIRRGIDFPPNWAEREQALDVGMAREPIVSAAVMFDQAQQPLALCWQVGSGKEHFVHIGGDDNAGVPLEPLMRDLEEESRRYGSADLFATLLWAPDDLRPDQGQWAHRVVFGRGRLSGITGWNIPPRTLVARAANLLVVSRRVDNDLALPVPADLEQMHGQLGQGDPRVLLVLPGRSDAGESEKNIGRKLAYLFAGLLAAGCLVSAYLLGRL